MNELGLNFEFEILSLSDINNGINHDLRSAYIVTDERKKEYYYSIPYIKCNYNIISRDTSFDQNIKDVFTKKFIVKKGELSHRIVTQMGNEYSKNMTVVEDLSVGLNLLSRGMSDIMITTSDIQFCRNIINEENINNLSVSGSDMIENEICFASKDRFLISDINKALITLIQSGKFEEIHNKWFKKDRLSNFYRYLFIALLIVSFLALFFLIFSYLLHKKVNTHETRQLSVP